MLLWVTIRCTIPSVKGPKEADECAHFFIVESFERHFRAVRGPVKCLDYNSLVLLFTCPCMLLQSLSVPFAAHLSPFLQNRQKYKKNNRNPRI